jgi:hypothetical protein
VIAAVIRDSDITAGVVHIEAVRLDVGTQHDALGERIDADVTGSINQGAVGRTCTVVAADLHARAAAVVIVATELNFWRTTMAVLAIGTADADVAAFALDVAKAEGGAAVGILDMLGFVVVNEVVHLVEVEQHVQVRVVAIDILIDDLWIDIDDPLVVGEAHVRMTHVDPVLVIVLGTARRANVGIDLYVNAYLGLVDVDVGIQVGIAI